MRRLRTRWRPVAFALGVLLVVVPAAYLSELRFPATSEPPGPVAATILRADRRRGGVARGLRAQLRRHASGLSAPASWRVTCATGRSSGWPRRSGTARCRCSSCTSTSASDPDPWNAARRRCRAILECDGRSASRCHRRTSGAHRHPRSAATPVEPLRGRCPEHRRGGRPARAPLAARGGGQAARYARTPGNRRERCR